MGMQKSQRLKLLLEHLVVDEFRAAPTGVGLKTAIEARNRGLVEILIEGREPVYRLTEARRPDRH